MAVLGGFHQDSDGLMPTLLQRIRTLAEGDLERERSWRAARKFALAAHDHQVVHVEGQEKQILPPGGLSAHSSPSLWRRRADSFPGFHDCYAAVL